MKKLKRNAVGLRVGTFFSPEDIARPDVTTSLAALADVNDKDLLSRCYAETIAPRWAANYAERNKLRPYKGHHFCIRTLLKGRSRGCYERDCIRPPGNDHAELWVDETNTPKEYVFHPYGLWGKTIAELAVFCKQYDLELLIDADSWYYPTRALRVVLTKREQ